MILLVDIGNARLKWAFYHEGRVNNPQGVLHKGHAPDALLEEKWQALDVPSSLWVSNVAGLSFQKAIMLWAQKCGHIPIHFAHTLKKQRGVQNGYTRPEQLGIDRWLALIAAHQTTRAPFCVVDYGSALTLDLVDREGQHLGGHILPGWHIWIRTLKAQFPQLELEASKLCFGQVGNLAHNTLQGVEFGYLTCVVGYLHFLFHRLKEDMGCEVQWILTGGDAPLLLPHLSFPVMFKPHLVLEGLAFYALDNEIGAPERT
ncbi:MAG: type III pantothenate kinase [Gammaproteobacteria bacterium]|nr:type III pantothenate kinase [Gammaproteobacteria bacterium]